MDATARRTISLALLLAFVRSVGVATAGPAAPPCSSPAFAGFDSRLQTAVVARLPVPVADVTGFEVSRGRPLVGTADRLLTTTGKSGEWLALRVPQRNLRPAVDAHGNVRFASESGVLSRQGDALAADPRLAPVAGDIVNSGSAVFLELFANGGATTFIARRLDGSGVPLLKLPGKVAAASWTPHGLAAIVGDVLVTWNPETGRVDRLGSDARLAAARDVVAIGPRRVVVALQSSLLLVTERRALVIATIPARVRWSDDGLYALNVGTGELWQVRGLGQDLGDRARFNCRTPRRRS